MFRTLVGCAVVLCATTAFAEPTLSDELDNVLGTSGATLPARTGDTAQDVESVRAWVRGRMTQDAFYESVLPRLFAVFAKKLWTDEFRSVLRVARVDGRDVYFDPAAHTDRAHPCATKEQTQVVPWWDDNAKVWVCTSDYAPTVTMDEKFPNTMAYCEVDHHPGTKCHCGTHLLYCAPADIYEAVTRAVSDEPLLTLRYIVEHHLPFSTLLTSNETARPGVLDGIYRRAVDGEHMQPLQMSAVERARVAWRARPPQFGGGLLTMPLSTGWDISRRVTGRIAWDDFLCMPLVAAKTHTADLFLLPDSNLRFHGQDRLTQMTGCKECHRRLEGIVHAYADFTLPMIGHRYVPANPPDMRTSFYGRDSHDLRAEGPATPAFVGATLVQQPELPGCVASRVEQLFFGGEAISTTDHERLRARFAEGLDLARLFEDVAVLRVLGSLDGVK